MNARRGLSLVLLFLGLGASKASAAIIKKVNKDKDELLVGVSKIEMAALAADKSVTIEIGSGRGRFLVSGVVETLSTQKQTVVIALSEPDRRVTNKLNVRADALGPMRIEINDNGGRPVLTKNVLVGTKAAELNVSQLPAGTYVVRCTAGEKTGTRLVRLGL